MAMADYHLCDNCGCKTFYDADLDGFYDPKTGEWLYGCKGVYGFRAFALCKDCEKTHEIVVQERNV